MGIKLQGDIETIIFFYNLSNEKNINNWITLNKRSETNDGFVTYEYDVPFVSSYQYQQNISKLSDIFKEKEKYDLVAEVYKEVDWSFSSIKGSVDQVKSVRIAQFEIVDFNSQRELYDWGSEKRISETENMVIRYGKIWDYDSDELNKVDFASLLLSIRREIKLNNLGL